MLVLRVKVTAQSLYEPSGPRGGRARHLNRFRSQLISLCNHRRFILCHFHRHDFQLVVQEMDGTVTGSVQNSPHHFGSGAISFGAFSGEFLVFETAFIDRGARWECTYTADRQPDQQTLIGEYSCSLLGSTVTDTGSWSATRIQTQ